MSRIYLQPSWVDACSDHMEWSGQSPDDRKRPSHMIGNKANLEAYRDAPEKSKKAPAKSIKEQIIPQSQTLDRLDSQELALHKAFDKGEVSEEDYRQCLNALTLKRNRAFKSYCKAAGIVEDVDIDTGEENAVFEGDFNVTKGHSETNKGGMSTVIFLSLVFIATIGLLIIAN
jgi:hypothetical protein